MLISETKQKKSKVSSATQCHALTSVLDHNGELPRLKRVRGQIDGIQRMVVERRYCIDILQQVKAARAALRAIETSILKTHLKGCVKEALASKNAFNADEKIQEIVDFVNRF